MKIESQIEIEKRINNKVKQRIKDRINEKMKVHIKNFENRNKTRNITHTKTNRQNKHNYSNYTQYIFNTTNQLQYLNYNTDIEEIEKFKNSSDYSLDKWTRNWNFYREQLTDNIFNKFDMNNKRQKRQTQIDIVELKGQNINGSAPGPQDIFIEHYDCDGEEITSVKYKELNKISTCKFKP